MGLQEDGLDCGLEASLLGLLLYPAEVLLFSCAGVFLPPDGLLVNKL